MTSFLFVRNLFIERLQEKVLLTVHPSDPCTTRVPSRGTDEERQEL